MVKWTKGPGFGFGCIVSSQNKNAGSTLNFDKDLPDSLAGDKHEL